MQQVPCLVVGLRLGQEAQEGGHVQYSQRCSEDKRWEPKEPSVTGTDRADGLGISKSNGPCLTTMPVFCSISRLGTVITCRCGLWTKDTEKLGIAMGKRK